jgi:hypothetical protein
LSSRISEQNDRQPIAFPEFLSGEVSSPIALLSGTQLFDYGVQFAQRSRYKLDNPKNP